MRVNRSSLDKRSKIQDIVKSRGFSLLELCIVLVIIAILGSIAFPSYQSHLVKTRRTDGQTALFHLALAMEKFAVRHHSYEEANFKKLNINQTSSQGYYQLNIVKAEENNFLITAVPLKSQLEDKICGTLAIDNKGQKGKFLRNKLELDKTCW